MITAAESSQASSDAVSQTFVSTNKTPTGQEPPSNFPATPPPPKIRINTIDIFSPPPPTLTAAGESAMLTSGLTNPTAPSLQISPWWTGPEVNPRPTTKEYYASQCAQSRRYAQRCTNKSEKWQNRKMQVQYDLLVRRSTNLARVKREGTQDGVTESLDTNDVFGAMLSKEKEEWLEHEWEWAGRKEKKLYRKSCRRIESYRRKALVTMTKAYYYALSATLVEDLG